MVMSSRYLLASSGGRLSILARRFGATAPYPSSPRAWRSRWVAAFWSSSTDRTRPLLSIRRRCKLPSVMPTPGIMGLCCSSPVQQQTSSTVYTYTRVTLQFSCSYLLHINCFHHLQFNCFHYLELKLQFSCFHLLRFSCQFNYFQCLHTN